MELLGGAFGLEEALLETGADPGGCFGEGKLAAGELRERHGIRGVGEETGLVDVDADADARMMEVAAHEGILDEDSADLAVADIDIIRPFHGSVHAVAGEEIGHGERHSLGDGKLAACREGLEAAEEGESEILARFGLPGIAPLAATGGLVLGHHHCHILELVGMDGHIAVSAFYGFEQEIVHSGNDGIMMVRELSGLTRISTLMASSGRRAPILSGHSMRHVEPE